MKITFTRHAESQANQLGVFSNRGLKHPLTLAGRQQAIALADALQGSAVTHIYSSPVLRAIETTVIIAGRLGVEYQVVEALREYDVGIFEGRSDTEAWLTWREMAVAWKNQQRLDQRIPGGESFYDVRQRLLPFIDALIGQYGQSDAHLVCVAHGGLYWMMLPLVLVNVDTEFIAFQGGFPYAVRITAELTSRGLLCTAWNGAALDAAQS